VSPQTVLNVVNLNIGWQIVERVTIINAVKGGHNKNFDDHSKRDMKFIKKITRIYKENKETLIKENLFNEG
jgi:hypothetical protein